MPVNPEAIERYLGQPIPSVPPFKGMSPDALQAGIERLLGIPFEPMTEPRPWQLEGLAFALWAKQGLLFFAPRLGKTKCTLDWAEHLRKAGKWQGKGLIVAHSPIGLDVWEGEAAKHSNLKLRCVRNKPSEFMDAMESNCDLVVTPWSGLQAIFSIRKEVRGKTKLVPDQEIIRMVANCFDLCAMDEIHMCKNFLSLRFKIASLLTQFCTYRLGLTGTPVGRNPYALWAQAFLVDRGRQLGTNYFFFEQAFGYKKYNPFTKTKEEWKFNKKLMPNLQNKLAPITLSYQFSEVKQVEVLEGKVELNMQGEQLRAYNGFLHDHVDALKNADDRKVQNAFIRMRQISSGYLPFTNDDGEERFVYFPNPAKTQWLEDMLEDLDDTRLVLFHEFTRTGEMLCELLTKLKIGHTWLYGGTKDRTGALHAFQSGKAQVFVVNSATGGTGIDLSVADHLIFFETPVSPIIRAQAEARPMARDRLLIRDDVVCSSIEHRVLGFVKEGKDALREIMKNPKNLSS